MGEEEEVLNNLVDIREDLTVAATMEDSIMDQITMVGIIVEEITMEETKMEEIKMVEIKMVEITMEDTKMEETTVVEIKMEETTMEETIMVEITIISVLPSIFVALTEAFPQARIYKKI